MERRLAIYLVKKFVSQKLHRRFVQDLARALPIETVNESNARKVLTRAAKGLLDRGFRKPLVPYFSPLVASDGRGERW